MKIYKYKLQITDIQTVTMPYISKILTVQKQTRFGFADYLCMWAQVDETSVEAERKIAIYGTGNPMPERAGNYIATVQMDIQVWHIYDISEMYFCGDIK